MKERNELDVRQRRRFFVAVAVLASLTAVGVLGMVIHAWAAPDTVASEVGSWMVLGPCILAFGIASGIMLAALLSL